MSDPKLAKTGMALRGRIEFSAATQGFLDLKQGGAWPAGGYSIDATPLPRTLDQVDVTTVTNATLYFVDIDGHRYPFTSSGAATAGEIRDGLIAAINLGSPTNGVTAIIVDADSLAVRGIRGGEFHVVTGSTGAALLTVTPGLETVPNWGAFADGGRAYVRTSSAFTGAFDILVQG